MDAIVGRNFGPAERGQWARVSPELREQAFFRGWTRKEAYVKAIGSGLALPLERFDVSILPEEVPRLINVDGWSLYDLEVPGYAAALVVQGEAATVRAWYLEPGADWARSGR
jgi:4'-phosphopantetheinyl transferase